MIRHAARLIVLDAQDRLLLFRARTPQDDREFWVMPGGGLPDGETHEIAAARELHEETGLRGTLGPCVWTRRHPHQWGDRFVDQRERYYVIRVAETVLAPTQPDDYTLDHRWWTPEEIQAATATLVPRNLPALLPPILAGVLRESPVEAGI